MTTRPGTSEQPAPSLSMSMKMLAIVACGGALGAVLRYGVYVLTAKLAPSGFPVATLAVNIIGSAAMGAFVEAAALRWNVGLELRTFVAVGLLGAFTTFSTFSLDAVVLYQRDRLTAAALYVALSVVCCIAGLLAGMALVRRPLL